MSFEADFYESVRDLEGLTVLFGDFVAATPEGCERSVFEPIVQLLARVRAATSLRVVFVAQFLGDLPAVRERVPGPPERSRDEGEALFGEGVLAEAAGRRPPRCLSLPVICDGGQVYGTVCVDGNRAPARLGVQHAAVLESTARIVALVLSRSAAF
jgi:hypothetical protein